MLDVHCCGDCHPGVTISGSPDIYVNDEPVARIGDEVDCGSMLMTGSPDVYANE